MRRIVKFFLRVVLIALLLAGAGWFLLRPYAVSYAQKTFQAAGYPQGVVQITGLAPLHIKVQESPEAAPLLEGDVMPLDLWRARGQTATLAGLKLACPQGQSGNAAQAFDFTQPLKIPTLPFARLQIEDLSLICNGFAWQGRVDITPTQADYTGTIMALGQMVPLAGRMVLNADGSLTATAESQLPTWKNEAAAAQNLTLHIRAEMGKAQPRAVVDLTAQQLQMGGLPLSAPKVQLVWQPDAPKNITLKAAQAGVFGGQVRLKPASLPLDRARPIHLMAQFNKVDLAQLVQITGLEGLGGVGLMSGQVPLTVQGQKVVLGKAELSAEQAGQVRYAPAVMPSFMATGGQGALLGQILSDFHYKVLTLKAAGTLGQDLTLSLRLEGNNPQFYNGRAVAFNLNLSGALESLLKDGLNSYNLSPQALGQMVQKGSTP